MTFALRRPALALAAALLFATPVLAAEPAPFLTPANLDLSLMLPPPPPAGSAIDKSEIGAIIAVQKNASPERVKLAVEDAEETIFAMFTRTLGDKFVAGNLPKAAVFFERVVSSEDEITDPAKKIFGRVRPYMASTDVKAQVPASKSGSWPSGHTTRVTMAAIVLAAMLPERKEAIWARADQYGESRIVGGMHYPSDIEAGRRAGTAMAAVMFTQPEFKAEFPAVKAEVRAALGLGM